MSNLTDRQFIEEGLNKLTAACNIMGNDATRQSDVVRYFSRQHRSIQQSFMKIVIMPILRHLANAYFDGNYDGRNEASAKLAFKMLDALSEDDQYLPLI